MSNPFPHYNGGNLPGDNDSEQIGIAYYDRCDGRGGDVDSSSTTFGGTGAVCSWVAYSGTVGLKV